MHAPTPHGPETSAGRETDRETDRGAASAPESRVPFRAPAGVLRCLWTVLGLLLSTADAATAGELRSLTTRQLVERVAERVEGRLSGYGLLRPPGQKTFLRVRPSSEEADGKALYRSPLELVERSVPLLKEELIAGTMTKRYVEAGTRVLKQPAQPVTIFLSRPWHPPDGWDRAPARRTIRERELTETVTTITTLGPFPMNRIPERKTTPVKYKETVSDEAIEILGYRGRLEVTRHEGQRTEVITEGVQQTRAVAVNRDEQARGYLVIEEPPHRLGIVVEARSAPVGPYKTWVPTMPSADVVRLLEVIAWEVKSELGLPVPPEPSDPVPGPEGPGGPPEPPRDDLVAEMETEDPPLPAPPGPISDVIGILVSSGRHEQALVRIRARLRACVVAIDEERELLRSVRATLAVTDAESPHRPGREAWAKEIEAKIAALEEERDSLLADALRRWDGLRKDLDDVIGGREDSPAIQRDLMSYRVQLELRQQLSELELLFAAGKSAELRARLPEALRHPALAERAELLRVGDLLDRGRMAEALHASRLGASRYPDNPAFGHFLRDLEISYLKAISSKAVDDGARLHAAWDDYVEGADASYAWQMFFGGLKHTYHRATGKAAKMEVLATSGFDRAAMEHNGIELMLRLRAQDLTFDEIQDLDEEGLRRRLIAMAPGRGEPSPETVENFSVALKAAFLNDDVIRLRYPGPSAVRLSEGSYYSAGEFEETWGEYALGAVSAKNMLMIFGPAATLGGIPGSLARLAARLGRGPEVAAAFGEETAALTIGEWVCSTQSARSLAAAVANTRAGGALREAGHVLRELRYHDRALVRWGTAAAGFATQAAGQWLLMEGAGAVGDMMGGERGRIAGELAAGMVGLPGAGSTARLQARMERARALMAEARARSAATEAVLKALRVPIHEAAETLSRPGGKLSATQRSFLEEAAGRADETAASTRSAAAAAANSPLVHGAADEASALAASARASLAGRADDALGATQIARTLSREVERLGSALEAGERRIAQALAEVTESAPARGLTPGRPPRAPASAPSLLGEPGPPRTRIPQLDDAVPSVPPPPPPPPPKPGVAALEQAAEAAMKAERFDEAAALLHAAARHADLAEDAAPRIRAALAEARGAAKAKEVFAAREALPHVAGLADDADQAMEAFDAAQRAHLGKLGRSDMTPLPGAGGAHRIDGPDGKPLAVWKPGRRGTDLMDRDGQIVAEVLTSRLGRRLGLRVPYAEPMMVDGILGVVIRWVPATTDLKRLSPGARAALKRQMAGFRPLQTFLGNYDVHMGNFKLDRAGRVWAIDAGQSILHTPDFPVPDLAGALAGASPAVNWTRWLRDWYSTLGSTDARYAPSRRMQELITGSGMQESARALRSLSRDELRAAVQESMRGAPMSVRHTDEVLETLFERQGNLPSLLNERWAGALP